MIQKNLKNERHLRGSNSRGKTPIGLAGQRLNHSAKVSLYTIFAIRIYMYALDSPFSS
jgi:hypothetical protein